MYPGNNNRQRLAALEEILEILYEKLSFFQKEIAETSYAPAKLELKGRLKREVLPDIRKYEIEYGQLLAQVAENSYITDIDAESTLVEVVQAVEYMEVQRSDSYPEEVLQLLMEIREKLNEPGKAAAAKLKIALPIVPAIASYEMEMDTEAVMTQAWQKMKKLFRGKA
jgi:hypothetical protein